MPSVLITRPRATAEPLAKELERFGYRAVVEPLLEITPLSTPRPQGNGYDAVMITSGNALPALEARSNEIADLFNLPCFCVGPRTAEKAAAFGFRQLQTTENDGIELARLAASALGKNSLVLHIAGRDVDSKAQQELEQQGHRVTVWPVYEATPVTAFTAKTQTLLKQQQLDAIMVYSPRTAVTLSGLLKQDALEACCPQLAAICLSDAVAAVLKPFPWRRLAAAPAPAERAIIACLQETCPVKS